MFGLDFVRSFLFQFSKMAFFFQKGIAYILINNKKARFSTLRFPRTYISGTADVNLIHQNAANTSSLI